jgi:6,7-dimethyl-8-ribityllumazine synthase
MIAEPRREVVSEPTRAFILIVEARYYEPLADELLKGARAALARAGATFVTLTVPGALEVPATVAMAIETAEAEGRPFDGVVALGCVIRGETYHFEIVAVQASRGLMDLSVALALPIGNGILTVENEDQAWERARVTEGDKGGGAAEAVLSLIRTKRRLPSLLEEA